MPFTEFESMLVVQQALLQLKAELAAPVNKAAGRMYGDIALEVKDQPEVRSSCAAARRKCAVEALL
jgi:hypothetical protein